MVVMYLVNSNQTLNLIRPNGLGFGMLCTTTITSIHNLKFQPNGGTAFPRTRSPIHENMFIFTL